jgi:hypothetical protein
MLLPTPKAAEGGWKVENTTTKDGDPAQPGQRAYDANGQHKTWGLQQVVDVLLPTPVADDGRKASSNPETNQRRIDKGQQPYLTDIVQTTWRVTEEGNEPPLLPTPRAMSGGPDNTAGKDRPSGHKGTTNLHGLVQDLFAEDTDEDQ